MVNRMDNWIGCDGLFLIYDTARHNGWTVDEQEIEDHVSECDECEEVTL